MPTTRRRVVRGQVKKGGAHMCVSGNTSFFPVDFCGCTREVVHDGKEGSELLVAFELRDNGNKIVLMNTSDEVTVKLIRDGDTWFSSGRPVKLIMPNGESVFFARHQPATLIP